MTASEVTTTAPAVGPRTASTHLLALDGYRAAAAIMVLLTHVAFATGVVVTSGWGHLLGRLDFGVTLFFLLSGFLLYRPWAKAALAGGRPPRLGRYFLRRAARILPLYWVVVVVVLALLPEARPVSGTTWWRHLLALQIYWPAGASSGLTQTWSLCTEIAFYLLLPVLGALALGRRPLSPEAAWRRQWIVIGACMLVGLGFVTLKGFTDVLPEQSGYWLPFYLDWFATGMALAVLEVGRAQALPHRLVRYAVLVAKDQWTTLVVAGALFAVVVTPIGGAYVFSQGTGPWETLARHVLYGVVGAALLSAAVFGGDTWLARNLGRSGPRRVGLVSYGIFLWHVALLSAVQDWLGIPMFSGRFLEVALILTTVTLAVSTVTYVLIERPFQRWAHRR
jgi:peptidoglycan/LPS O-acetylase OafA/YrhL